MVCYNKNNPSLSTLLITAEHKALQDKYQQLLSKSLQHDAILRHKDELIQQLQQQITPLKNAVEQLIIEVKQIKSENLTLQEQLREKDKRIQKLELVEHG